MRFSLAHVVFSAKTKKRARRLPRDEMISLCRDIDSVLYSSHQQPKLQGFRLPTIPEVVEFATKFPVPWVVFRSRNYSNSVSQASKPDCT